MQVIRRYSVLTERIQGTMLGPRFVKFCETYHLALNICVFFKNLSGLHPYRVNIYLFSYYVQGFI